jgi:hypothetical protein
MNRGLLSPMPGRNRASNATAAARNRWNVSSPAWVISSR